MASKLAPYDCDIINVFLIFSKVNRLKNMGKLNVSNGIQL